ncbi:DgyrCDS14783 [Dimorphilus gyrociliatus]|uniref:DgyrCDS14783 n=1 Tax=Dimorphilus gyrociliatus TaxID=2664684 RepID=A0A7I8WEX0_9ANNE|nr:DgyrCDS14783 [Dimorphilus gyrociliatus]
MFKVLKQFESVELSHIWQVKPSTIGTIYFNSPDDSVAGVQNRVGVFFFLAMNQAFINLSALELFIRERVIFKHENVSGFYRCSTYYCLKIICDLLPIRALPLIVFSVIVYWMLDLSSDAGKFFFFLLTLYCTTITACAICFAFSATFETFAIANIATAMSFVIMMLFSGMLVKLDSIGNWLEWVKYLSLMRYCLAALIINEFKGLELQKNGTSEKALAERFTYKSKRLTMKRIGINGSIS